MKKKNIILMIIVILIFTILFFRNIIGACIFHSEEINKTEITAMLKSRFNPDKTVEIEVKGKKYTIPLPNGAARYSSIAYSSKYQYLVPTGSLNIYFNTILPANGWEKYDQEGAEIFIRNKDSKDVTFIAYEMFTLFYYRVTFLR